MSYGNEKKLNKYLPVVFDNDLTKARFQMDLWERRLMYVCMSKLKPDDINFPEITFSISEIAKLLDIKSLPKSEYQAIYDASEKLLDRKVKSYENGIREGWNWVSKFKCDENTKMITMKFCEDMKPFLLNLIENRGYTKFLLKYAMPLSSIYAQRFYEMYRSLVYEGQAKAVQRVELQELRDRLEMPNNKNKLYGHFKTRVLDIAEREINSKTDIFISFKEVRSNTRGKPVIAIIVSVILKVDMIHEWDRYMLWQKDDLLEKLSQLVAHKKSHKLDLTEFDKYSHESIARLAYEIANDKLDLTDIKNCQKFLIWQLEQWKTEMGMNQLTLDVNEKE